MHYVSSISCLDDVTKGGCKNVGIISMLELESAGIMFIEFLSFVYNFWCI